MANIADLLLGSKTVLEFDPVTGGYFLKVKIENEAGTDFPVDDTVNAVVTIDSVHHEVHEGEMFFTSFVTGSVTNNSSIGMMISLTGTANSAHLFFAVACGGDAEIYFYEGMTGSNYGNILSHYNMNRNSSNTTSIVVSAYPITTVTGTLLANYFVPGGRGPTADGGAFRSGSEWNLAPGKRYLLRIFNRSGNTQYASLAVEFYEEPI